MAMTNYGGYYFPNYEPPQQRLMNLEQQYPQFVPSNMGNMGQPQIRPSVIKGRVVTSLEEVKGCLIDLDGSVHVFPDPGNNKIYTKQLNMRDGTSIIHTYVREDMANSPGNQGASLGLMGEDSFVPMEDFEELKNTVDKIVKELYGEEKK